MPCYSTGYELVLNACEGMLQIAVTEDERLLCFQEWDRPRGATELLAPVLAEIFRHLGISAQSFRRIGCFAGPGSFTGIRLVLATASAIRRATKAQLGRLDYLQALATSAVMRRGALYPAKVFVITHARRDLLHFQEFCSYGPQIPAQPVNEAELLAPEKALASISGQKCLVCGSGLARHPEIFALPTTGEGPCGAPAADALPDLVNPDVQALCLLARHGDYFPTDVEPKYVRGCDAVENLERKAAENSSELEEMRKLLDKPPVSDI